MKHISCQDYSIEIGALQNSSFASFLAENYANAKIVVIVDENTHDNCLEYLITNFKALANAEVMLIPAGEENKVLEVCFQIWEALSDYKVGRRDLILNLGGGMVTDLGGFVASVFKRGVDFIHIPTSLLGMVDASIGGKTGIDLGPYKNQIGTFFFPKAVYIDPHFLQTLPDKEIVNGFAEMLKHGLIADASLFSQLEKLENLKALFDEEMIYNAVAIKQEIVQKDPTEKGLRKNLNFGHTAGHALEGFFLQKKTIDHGHAVGLGMLIEAYLSQKKGNLSKVEFERIEQLLLGWYSMVDYSIQDIPVLIDLLKNDKKNHSNSIQVCLLDGIGECKYDQVISESEFTDAFMHLLNKNVGLN